jgi:hypothetical protein
MTPEEPSDVINEVGPVPAIREARPVIGSEQDSSASVSGEVSSMATGTKNARPGGTNECASHRLT